MLGLLFSVEKDLREGAETEGVLGSLIELLENETSSVASLPTSPVSIEGIGTSRRVAMFVAWQSDVVLVVDEEVKCSQYWKGNRV